MSFIIKLKFRKLINTILKLVYRVVTSLAILSFLFFSLGTTIGWWLQLDKWAIRLLKISATIDLGGCNIAEYQLGTAFMYGGNYEMALNYYWRMLRSPLACFKNRAYYNIGGIYANMGYSFLQKKYAFGTLDMWLISLGAFKKAVIYGEKSKFESVKDMVHNIHVVQNLMYKYCVNVSHPKCPAKSYKEAIDSTKKNKKSGESNNRASDSEQAIDSQKAQELVKRQKKAISEQQKNSSRNRWYNKAKKGDRQQGW